MMSSAARLTVLAIATAIAFPATAHTFGPSGAGFTQGLAHPFGGADHVLAMLAVGIWASLSGRKAVWLMPVGFMGAMAAGGALAIVGVALPAVEAMIAASLMAFGLSIAWGPRVIQPVAMALVAFFGLFHGHAHGAELPLAASAWHYALGFVIATGVIHVVGVAIGMACRRAEFRLALRLGGAGIGVTGLIVLAI